MEETKTNRDTLERRPADLSEPAVIARLTEATKNVLAAASELMTDKYKFDPFTSIEDNQEQKIQQDNGWFERGELPPAGVVCEVLGGGKWHKTEVIGMYDGHCVVFTGDFRPTVFDAWDNPEVFRPIRTERDELMDVIASQWSLSKDGGVCGQVADAIMAAGFKRDGGAV